MTNKMIGVSNMKTLKMITMLAASMCVGVFMLGCTDAVPTESAIQINNTKPKQSNVEIVNLGADQDVIKQINMELNSNPPAAGGKTYYVCDTGNDENTGMSESSPFRSYEKAMATFATITGGDSVLLCRGGQFPITKGKGINNLKCSIGAPCTLGDYGDKSKDKPLIISSDTTSALKFYGNIDSAKSGGGYVIKNLNLLSTTGAGKGVFLYIGVHHMLLENLHIQGFSLGMQIAGSTTNFIKLKDSVIINSKQQGVLGGCTNCLYENNHFENNGSGMLDHNIYLSSTDGIVSNMTVRGNTLYKSSMVDGKCGGVSLVVHGKFEGITIENNLIKEDVGAAKGACYGISVDPGYAYEEYFKDVVIRGNTLLNVGGNAIGCASCDGALIENNTIIDEGSVLVNGIAVPVRTEDTVKSKNVVIRNNKVLLTKNWNGTTGVRVGGLHPMTAKNNDVYLPDYPLSECVRGEDKNIDIDDSSNTCQKTVSPSTLKSLVQTLLNTPYKQTPIEETSTEETSTEDTSTEDTSTEDTSTEDTSTEDTSTEDTSTEDTSTEDTSTEETSTEETSTEETSTEKTSTEKTSTEKTAVNETYAESKPRRTRDIGVSAIESHEKDALASTTYKAGSLFSSSNGGGSSSGTVQLKFNKTCKVYARGRCLM
jgi:hypothetical protein